MSDEFDDGDGDDLVLPDDDSERFDPYYRRLTQFQFEVTQRQYRRALTELREGLELAIVALPLMRESGGIPYVPFYENQGGAIAALFNDERAFALMEQIAAFPFAPEHLDVARFRRDAEIMEQARRDLSDRGILPLDEIKRTLAPNESRRLMRLLIWMQKNGELWVDRRQKAATVSLGRPRADVIAVPPFRDDLSAVETPVIDLSLYPTAPVSDYEPLDSEAAPLAETPTRQSERLSGTSESWAFEAGTWLVGIAREQANGTRASEVMRRDRDGRRVSDITLPFKTLRSRDLQSRNYVAVADEHLNFRAIDFDGNVLWEAALLESPEVVALLEGDRRDTKPSAMLRMMDIDLDRGEVAFSLMEHIYRFTLDGMLVMAARLPGVPNYLYDSDDALPNPALPTALVSRGLSPESSREQIAAYLEARGLDRYGNGLIAHFRIDLGNEDESDELDFLDDGGMTELNLLLDAAGHVSTDWCYFLRFMGDDLFVGGYNGSLLRIGRSGAVLASWQLPAVPDGLWESNDELIISSGGAGGVLSPGNRVTPSFDIDGGTHVGDYLYAHGRRIANVTNLRTGETRWFSTQRDIRGMWRSVDGFEILTTTTSARIVEF